jgi:phenylacetate-coenzyme A ligase PaaK-like adenylate-forming protein
MMDFIQDFKDNLFKTTPDNFNEKALKLFRYQAANNPVYKEYLENLRFDISSPDDISRVPFLPISFFKNHEVLTGNPEIKEIFSSSGTTGSVRSRHLVADPGFYKKISAEIFRKFYGDLKDHIFISLLPSYQENPGSSLIFMINHFMRESAELSPGFISKDISRFPAAIEEARTVKKKIILFGVGFALLDLAAAHDGLDLSDLIMIETGGMKGRREEMTRPELHELLKKSFNLGAVHSEYGMTELLSQAYAKQEGVFETPPWMKIFIRDINDPFSMSNFRNGGINIVDLANVQSCAFIETEDIGRKLDNNSFEILGRFDNSDVRGCNLLYFN